MLNSRSSSDINSVTLDLAATSVMATRVAPSKQTEADSMMRQKRRHLAKYTKGAPYTKVLSICAWDRDESGQLKVFQSEEAVLEHEAGCGERRKNGEYPAGGYAKLGKVMTKLAQNIQENNQIEHDETRDVVREEAEKVRGDLDAIREHEQLQLTELKAQVSQLAPSSAKRLVVNRYAFVSVQEGVSNYFRDGQGEVQPCEDDAPVEGRAYCRLVYVEQEKIGEPGTYYCAGQGAQKADELHNWSTLVRVKTAEACIKPTLPKSLHAIGGQKAKVVSEDGDTLRVKAPLFGDKTFSVRREFVEFLPPDREMPPAAKRPRGNVRKTAKPAPAPTAPHPPAAGEDCFDERAAAFDERAAASDTASHGTVAAQATAKPTDSEEAAKRSGKGEPTSSNVLLRKLQPKWADALAKGEKLVEYISYKKGHINTMKRFTAGTVMVVSTSGSRSVAAVAVAAGQAVVRQQAQDISAALDLVHVSLRTGVQEYLSGKATFDYVVLGRCYDLRPHGVQLEQFYDRFDVTAPKCFTGFPALKSSSPGLAERVLQWCLDLGAEQYCRANPIVPSPANKQHQPSSSAPTVPGNRSPQQVDPRDLDAPATPVKSQFTQDPQFIQNKPSECSSQGVSDADFKYSFKAATRRSSHRPEFA